MRALSAIIGMGIGAIALSLINFLLHVIFEPELLRDGQYILILFFFVPQGAWLGGFMGYAIATVYASDHRKGAIALFVASVLFVIAALLSVFGKYDRWGYLIGYFGFSLIWAIGLFIWAIFWKKDIGLAVPGEQ